MPAIRKFLRLLIPVVAGLGAAPAPAWQSGPSFVSYDDYPRRALREGREGTTEVRVVIGVNGRVRSCEIARSSGHSDLDAATCHIMRRRARYRAARNGAGQAVEDTVEERIAWIIRR